MRNLLNKASGVAIAIAAAALLSSGSANAQGATVRIDEADCGVFDADMNVRTIVATALGGDAVVQAVLTPSGNSKVTCTGMLPVGSALPEKGAEVFTFEDTGARCWTTFGTFGIDNMTEDYTNVVTKSGRVSLTCHFKPE